MIFGEKKKKGRRERSFASSPFSSTQLVRTCSECERKWLTFLNYSLIWDVNTRVFYMLQQKEDRGVSMESHHKREPSLGRLGVCYKLHFLSPPTM